MHRIYKKFILSILSILSILYIHVYSPRHAHSSCRPKRKWAACLTTRLPAAEPPSGAHPSAIVSAGERLQQTGKKDLSLERFLRNLRHLRTPFRVSRFMFRVSSPYSILNYAL
jgi:hypothetical protein